MKLLRSICQTTSPISLFSFSPVSFFLSFHLPVPLYIYIYFFLFYFLPFHLFILRSHLSFLSFFLFLCCFLPFFVASPPWRRLCGAISYVTNKYYFNFQIFFLSMYIHVSHHSFFSSFENVPPFEGESKADSIITQCDSIEMKLALVHATLKR